MEVALIISIFFCFITFIWNLSLLDENFVLHDLLKEYSYQIEQDTILFNDILEEVQTNENDEKNNN